MHFSVLQNQFAITKAQDSTFQNNYVLYIKLNHRITNSYT